MHESLHRRGPAPWRAALPILLTTGLLLLPLALPLGAGETIALSPGILADRLSAPGPGAFSLTGVLLRPGAPPSALDLTPLRVLADDAVLLVHDDTGGRSVPFPFFRAFAGAIRGEPGSRAFLTLDAEGEVRGVVSSGPEHWLLRERGGDLELAAVDPVHDLDLPYRRFECEGALLPPGAAEPGEAPPPLSLPAAAPSYLARVAVETDVEYFSLFGSVNGAVAYALGLIGYTSTIYGNEVGTPLLVSHLSLWTTVADPWTQTTSYCALMELGRYWNDNRTAVQRTLVHQLSGRASGGGMGWTGVLCWGPFPYDHGGACPGLTPQLSNYGGAYSYLGAVSGTFDPQNPTVMWDIYATSHEIGHNFGSPHSHCYNGIGHASPVDGCHTGEAGCYAGTAGVPGIGTVIGGTPGQGNGTIMSYCHLQVGSYASVSLTLGLTHPFGVLGSRVPQVMAAHVASSAAGNPICLAYVLFADGFEGGTLVPHWSAKDP
jgi:hypothetical protein